MTEISVKELSLLQDLLSSEELLIKKFQMLADHSNDAEIKQQFTAISAKHQGHFNAIYSQLQ